MKIKWQKQELICITLLVAFQLLKYLLSHLDSNLSADTFAGSQFREVFLPRSLTVLLFYGFYLILQLLIWPGIRPLIIEGKWNSRILSSITSLIVLCALLWTGVHFLTILGKPYSVNYSGYQLLALLGYNDLSHTNLLFGYGRSLVLATSMIGYFSVREFAILYFVGKKNGDYIPMIINKITTSFYIILTLVFGASTFFGYDTPIFSFYLFKILIPATCIFITLVYFMFPAFIDEQKIPIWNVIKIIAVIIVIQVIFLYLFRYFSNLFNQYYVFPIQFLITLPFSWFYYKNQKENIMKLRAVEKALTTSTADLQFLKSQINPHFLFNTLNTLYGTSIKEGAQNTADGIQKLGDMMRFMLHQNHMDFIPVDKEIEYLRNYIDLQKMRIQDSPDIKIIDNIGEMQCPHKITPMLLIPFVENAFKHGISLKEKSWIQIKIDCNPKSLIFDIRNSKHDQSKLDNEPSGVGLQNVKERLKLLHNDMHELKITETNEEFIAILKLTFK